MNSKYHQSCVEQQMGEIPILGELSLVSVTGKRLKKVIHNQTYLMCLIIQNQVTLSLFLYAFVVCFPFS